MGILQQIGELQRRMDEQMSHMGNGGKAKREHVGGGVVPCPPL